MVRRVVLVVFFLLLLLVSGILIYYYFLLQSKGGSNGGCGIMVENKSERLELSIDNEKVWKNFGGSILSCDGEFISIFSPMGGDIKKLLQVKIVLTDDIYRGTKKWDDTETILYFDYSFSEDENVIYYYISPQKFNSSDIEDLSRRVGIFVNYILVSLTEDSEQKKSLRYQKWDTSGKTLKDMGLELETI